MRKKQTSKESIIQAFLTSCATKGAGATSLTDVAEILEIQKASLYNYFSSRDEIYNETVDYCADQLTHCEFFNEALCTSAAQAKNTASAIFKKAITQYFKMIESEPFFKMYIFLHTEQHFNKNAMDSVVADYNRLSDETKNFLKVLKTNKKCKADEKDFRNISNTIVSLLLGQLDLYMAQKQEIIRLNPDSGVGSLFSLPADENFMNRYIKAVLFYIEQSL